MLISLERTKLGIKESNYFFRKLKNSSGMREKHTFMHGHVRLNVIYLEIGLCTRRVILSHEVQRNKKGQTLAFILNREIILNWS